MTRWIPSRMSSSTVPAGTRNVVPSRLVTKLGRAIVSGLSQQTPGARD